MFFLLVFVMKLWKKSEIGVKPNPQNFKKGAFLKTNSK